MRQRRREFVSAVDQLERRDLAVGKARCRTRILRIGFNVVRTPLGGPGIPVGRALAHVENGSARHVVINDAVRKSIEFVALPDEFGANGFGLRGSHPIGRRLFLDADQFRSQHQRREADDRDVSGNAVVIGGITLSDRQRFTSTLRRADEIVIAGPRSVESFY